MVTIWHLMNVSTITNSSSHPTKFNYIAFNTQEIPFDFWMKFRIKEPPEKSQSLTLFQNKNNLDTYVTGIRIYEPQVHVSICFSTSCTAQWPGIIIVKNQIGLWRMDSGWRWFLLAGREVVKDSKVEIKHIISDNGLSLFKPFWNRMTIMITKICTHLLNCPCPALPLMCVKNRILLDNSRLSGDHLHNFYFQFLWMWDRILRTLVALYTSGLDIIIVENLHLKTFSRKCTSHVAN